MAHAPLGVDADPAVDLLDAPHAGATQAERASLLGRFYVPHHAALAAAVAGSLVPLPYYGKEARVVAVMLELNRSRYLDEESGRKSEHFAVVAGHVQQVCRDLLALAKRQLR